MIINDFNIKGMTIYKPETEPPRSIYRNRPLPFPITFEFVETHIFQMSQFIKAVHFIKKSKSPLRHPGFKTTERILA